MKRTLMLACAGALALSACATTTVPPVIAGGPVVVADQTKLDEQLGLSLTLAYTAAAKAAALAIQLAAAANHPLSPATVARIGQLDTQAYSAVMAVRQAYLAGNSASYLAAIVQARAAVANLLASFGGSSAQLLAPASTQSAYADAKAAHAGLAVAKGR